MALAGASVLVVWLLNVGLDFIAFDPQWWVGAPSFAACYSALLWLFDRFLWRLGLLRKLNFIDVPDLNGAWDGEVETSYDQSVGPHPVFVRIVQRWLKISIELQTEQSQSRSTLARLSTTGRPNPELTYQYINEPDALAPSTMEIHKGTATLVLRGSSLVGSYYTGRGRGEVGTIKLRRDCVQGEDVMHRIWLGAPLS